jgi:hypothetical protein
VVNLAIYCCDTSALIDLRRRYPPKVFGALWTAIEDLIAAGRLMAPREVLRELEKGDDEMYKFAKKHPAMFVDLDGDQQHLLAEIVTAFPKWVDTDTDRPVADPMVIALARHASLANGGATRIVVSHEMPGGKGATKIPNVCQQYSIQHVQLVELFEREDWSFPAAAP